MPISNWSTNPGDNDSAPPNGAPEGHLAGQTNNIIRQVMADVRLFAEDGGWLDRNDSPSFASATTFIVNTDLTAVYSSGRRLRAVGATTGTIYGTIVSSSFSSPSTTVTAEWDSGSLQNEALTISIGPNPLTTQDPVIVNVLEFGALGDGVTDDSAAIQAAVDSGADVLVFENRHYVMDSSITITRDIVVEGNGARLTGDGELIFQGSITTSQTTLASAASRNDQSISVADATGLAADDLIRIRDPANNSWSPFNATDRVGEFQRIHSISGNVVTVAGRLEDAYPNTTGLVDLVSPIKVTIRNLRRETNDTTTDSCIVLTRCADSLVENVEAYGGQLRSLEINDCFNLVLKNASSACIAAAAGFQYGVSVADSQIVTILGGRHFGTRHAITLGTSGNMPVRHFRAYNCDVANSGIQAGAADFHVASADSAYIDCRIHSNAYVQGRDNALIRCLITSNDSDNVMAYGRLQGGTCGFYGCKVRLHTGFNFAQIIGNLGNDLTSQDTDSKLEFFDNEIEVNSTVTRLAFHVGQQPAGVDRSYYHRGNRLTGDLSGLASYVNYSRVAPADAPAEIEINGIIADVDWSTVALMTGSTTIAEASRVYFQPRQGTFTPVYVATGTDFQSIVYSAARAGTWRRIEDMVFFEIIIVTDNVTLGSGAGAVNIEGLPFDVLSSASMGGVTVGSADGFAGEEPMEAFPLTASAAIRLRYRTTSPTDSIDLDASDFTTGASSNANRVRVSGWYITGDNF